MEKWVIYSVRSTTFVALLSVVTIASVLVAAPKQEKLIDFGRTEVLKVLPAAVSSDGWENEFASLLHDLSDDDLYQSFDRQNAAYIATEENPVYVPPPEESAVEQIQSTSTGDSNEPVVPVTLDEIEADLSDEIDLSQPAVESSEEPAESEVEIEIEPTAFNDVLLPLALYFPLAQAVITEQQTNTTTTETLNLTPAFDEVVASSEEEDPILLLDEGSTVEDLVEPETLAATTTDSEFVESEAEFSETSSVAEGKAEPEQEEYRELLFSGFETADLEPGQFVTGLQLRMSLGARGEISEEGVPPRIEFLYGSSTESLTRVGSLPLDEEISNAVNGGYFLYALPAPEDIKQLKDTIVSVRFVGDTEQLEGLFVDALWLELDTRVVTKKDLLERGKADKLTHLKGPQITELISDEVAFSRDERPLFNLRYDSQRNVLVRGVRSLLGRKLVEVSEISIVHRGEGFLGVSPIITTTRDGLITVEFSESDKAKLRPGAYEVELVLEEGGSTFTDTFNFEWGILTINPDKSEYEVGEVADISIGALTPNGHTICQANLDLYLIAPSEQVQKVPVRESGLCDGNNIIDVPDFSAIATTTEVGTYEMYLERLDNETGESVLGYTTDTFEVVTTQELSIQRVGPTRIYPPSPYPMTLTVAADESFTGTLVERVPRSFSVFDTDAVVTEEGDEKILTWNVTVLAGRSKQYSYQFDAPDISPYLFNLGPAELLEKERAGSQSLDSNGTSTATSSTISSEQAYRASFIEHRQWQIASDAVGKMLLFWDDGASIPTDWVCVSCISGDPFFERFPVGSSTYNGTGGTSTHTHTASGSVLGSAAAATEAGGGTIAPTGHTHTYTPTISIESNLPAYRQLRVIRYDVAAGEPATIPAGAIGIFDVASSSLPVNWFRYSEMDGRYPYGENTPSTTGGSNTHVHDITGTTGASAGAGTRVRGGTTVAGASNTHTHDVTASTTADNHEPPYIEVLYAKLSSAGAPPNGLIAMWDEDVDNSWLDISSTGADPLNNRFPKGATTYGATGGADTHTPADVNGIVSSAPSATVQGRVGSAGSDGSHTHTVNVTGFSTANNLPPFVSVVFGKRQGTDPVYEQLSSRWYVNTDNLTPTDAWSVEVGEDLLEREPITSTSTPVKDGDEVRLRISAEVTNATSTSGTSFKLQFAAAEVCSAVSVWADVGDAASTTVWRGYSNGSLTDGATVPSVLLTSSTVAQSYEEDGAASSTPNNITVDGVGEWDFALQHNSAAPGTNYCFRMVEGDGSAFNSYTHYPQLYTNEAPISPTQVAPFDNEKASSTVPDFFFLASDPEGDKVHYNIEVDDDYTFGSPVLDRDTISNSSEFENQVLISDKAPFREGETVKFSPSSALTNGTTYYWRVRAQDPEASNEWGDWSVIRSITIDTALTASAWFQTETEQFDTNTLAGIDTTGDQVDLTTGSTTGRMTSTEIDFNKGTAGTAWDSFVFNDTETNGSISYQVEYLTPSEVWTLIPNSDLPGNSVGFGTSPVSLLDLDVSVYTRIRIVATLTDSSGSPSLQDWQVNWGFKVDTPTITRLFPNEQVGTTTPILEFTTADPQSDDLTYQVQWSQTPDFSASTTRTSDLDAGFANIDVGGDIDPFNSGDIIQFTIQAIDALSPTTTYWWRVRAKDTTGDDAYSFWTAPRSFTVIEGTEQSTWFQTTEEQFDTDILSGTVSIGTDAVTVATTASEAMVVYGEGSNSAPKYRRWVDSIWEEEGELDDVGAPVKWAMVKAATTREEFLAVTIGTDADVNAQVFSLGVWSSLQEMTTNAGSINSRNADVTYETLSGDAMVAYCDGDNQPSYRIWDGSTWETESTIAISLTGDCEWIQLASDPVSDEIIVLTRDVDGNSYEAQVWNGSSWGNSTTLGGITEETHEGMAVEYEESGNQAIIVTSDGNPARFRWNSWNGTTWGTSATVSIGDDLEWAKLVRDIGSDEMALCYQDEDTNIGTAHWSGSAWSWAASDEQLATAGKAKDDPGFACVFENISGRDNYELTTFTDTTQTNFEAWDGTAWSAAAQVGTINDTVTMDLARTGDNNIIGVFFDETNDRLVSSNWSGASWSTTTVLESNASVDTTPYGMPYSIAPRGDSNEGTVVVTPEIRFSDGTGPYWQEFSFNDLTPGSSEILYFIEYQTSPDTWELIPNTFIPGNDTGTSSGPIDLSNLNIITHSTIRPVALLTCDGSGNCPTLTDWTVKWAEGITISGTAQAYDQAASTTSGTVAVAVNGVLQIGKTGTISAGSWSIDNVTAFSGDIITVFVTGAADAAEAVGVAMYDGQGDLEGMELYERHVSLGADTSTTTPLTNALIGQYDFVNDEDVFMDVTGTTLTVCGGGACGDAELYILPGTYYEPGGTILGHDFENNGIFTAGSFTHSFSGSWDNNATTTLAGSTIVMSATSTTEIVDSTGAVTGAFENLTFGTSTGNAIWSLNSTLEVSGDLTIDNGTLARGANQLLLGGDLLNGSSGVWTGVGTTTFDGGTAATWGDQNSTLQNVGNVVIDGISKIVSLSDNVAAQSVLIGANDTFDASVSNYDITLYEGWVNQNNFVARNGAVIFAATTSGHTITTGGDAFYDVSFTGSGGDWAFSASNEQIDNDLTISAGVVTLPTGTTTVAGSFDSTGGQFANNNGTVLFTSTGAETVTLAGGSFTNVFNNVTFSGSGSWSLADVNATTTNDFVVSQGSVNLPSGTLAIGGSLFNTGGSFTAGTGTTLFYSSGTETITAGGSSFNNLAFDGAGSWSFTDSDVSATNDVTIETGTVSFPNGTLTIGGSYDNNATVTAGTGSVLFNASDAGNTINFGSSDLYDVVFAGQVGDFTITGNATTTNNFSLTDASDWVLQTGSTLAVGGEFTNTVGGASTTWTGTTLLLSGGAFEVNDKTDNGDLYDTLQIENGTQVSWWNSAASSYSVASGGALYSQDHNAVDGDLYIFGDYQNSGGAEYWSFATDFDGTDLSGGSERRANVRFANGATASLSTSTLEIIGTSATSTSIANQSVGTYVIDITGGTTTAQYYDFEDLGLTGISFLGDNTVTTLDDGSYIVGVAAGSALTIASSTIAADPAKQLFNVSFATTTAIAATNVTQTGGDPATFWWFRDGAGNLYGESFDSDTGNPGSIRFDDSSLILTISGTVYADAGTTPITGGASSCDGSAQVVRVVVDGGTSYTGSCSSADGTYSVSGVVVTGDPTLTIYLDGASGGEKAAVITRTPTANISDLDLYTNRVITRHEDVTPATISNLAVFDQSDDSDLQFTAATSSVDVLSVLPGNELFVWASTTFIPGGEVTLLADAQANGYDGTLYVDTNGTFNAFASSTLTIGGRMELAASSTFAAASTTVLMNATTTGKSITAPDTITFNNLTFDGVGGGWNLGADIVVLDDLLITNGTVTGTGDITVPAGDITGNGTLSLGAGTTTLGSTNSLGGTTAWTFFNLQLGDGVSVGTTTPLFTATTTIAGTLLIENAHFLDAGSTSWDLSGVGEVFVETGTYEEDASTIRYSGAGATVLSTTYYNLLIDSGAGSQTYTGSSFGIQVENDLVTGGTAPSTFDLNTNDGQLDVNGNVLILSNGTLSASDSTEALFAGDYTNLGTFIANGGSVRFDTAGSQSVAAGSSLFGNVFVDGAGTLTVTEHATATSWTLLQSGGFTLDSGQALAVGGTFFNALDAGDTTWTGSSLQLYGGGNYSLNAATTSDSYANLTVLGTTQVRMWNSDAATYSIDATASLYSQDHSDIAGDLYIYGSYENSSYDDHWSYATDFDGTALGGSARKVDVYLASGASATYNGGSLAVAGIASASTTIQNQGAGTYGIEIGTSASSTMQFYEVRDIDSDGLTFTGSATVGTLSNGDYEVSQTGGSAITVDGSVITANPAKTFTSNRFALDGVGSGFNVTATGTSVSSWRFTNHVGDIDGEAFDVDPDGDPGYIAWDDSAALITISGTVYEDEGVTAASICDGSTNNVELRVAGLTTYQTTCSAADGSYSISNVAYGTNDSLVVYIAGETPNGATVTKQPVSNINNLDIYEDRVIIRHENVTAMTIADMAVWDSSDTADIPFTAVDGGSDTLTIPVDHELIIWDGKTFAPGGDVTMTSGGTETFGGTVTLYSNANWTGVGSELLTVGGSFELDAGATFAAAPSGTTTFSTTGSGRVIDVNEDSFANIAFTGSGSWTVSDANLTANGDVLKSAGILTLPTGTTTVAGTFEQTSGTFDANSGLLYFTGVGTEDITLGGSAMANVLVSGGTYTVTDTNATSTGDVNVTSGSLTLPSGNFAVGGDFINDGATLAHGSGDILLTSTTTATLQASSSDLFGVRFVGGGTYLMADTDITLLGDYQITSGAVTMASGTVSIGGSFDSAGGTFTYAASSTATRTILFNSGDTGETIDPGNNEFISVQIAAPSGGYTVTGSATTTENFSLLSVSDFTMQSGTNWYVGGVFANTVTGGTTEWEGSTLILDGNNEYTVNTKVSGSDLYDQVVIGDNSDVRFWDSSATTTTVASNSSVYSQDHAGVSGSLYVFGDFHVSTTSEYWSYATDFDGADLSGGSERAVTVSLSSNSTTSVDGGSLEILGATGNETLVTNQGSGTFALNTSAGTLNAQYYQLRNLNADGLNISGTPTITSLSNGDFELAVDTSSLISVTAEALNANASLIISGNRFATTTAISGTNVSVSSTTPSAWTFVSETGNLAGEDYDVDGPTACGSVRWSDSACLITQQTHYRWRNDDGGIEAPAAEWFNTNWDARKRVRVQNTNSSTTANAVVELSVVYDSDMQADFDDLRFTSIDGITELNHWIGSTTNSGVAEVWVQIPSLAADVNTDLFMYYNNPAATSSSSINSTFAAADDFEDGNITEYSGQTTLFAVDGSFTWDGSNGLDNTSNETGRANTGGIFRTDQTVSQGETYRFMQYVDTSAGSGDETCALFGVQSTSTNYAICLEQFGVDRISLVKDAVDNDASGTILASSTVTYNTGWYEIEVEWNSDDTFDVTLTDASDGVVAANFTGTDASSPYTSGGIGFTFWFHYGGWDSVTSRPTLEAEPTVLFGAEQSDGGASWKAPLDTPVNYDVGDVARLRVAIENTGLAITNQQMQLEYAPQDTAPSCEAVDAADYTPVPVQASCGSSPLCMVASANITNGASTVDLLAGTEGQFVAGEVREDPSNTTGNIDIAQNGYTEVEYAVTPTINTIDENICFRVTDSGSDYDTYLSVGKLTLRFDPVLATPVLNGGTTITLLPGATTTVSATATATDLNGFADLSVATTTFYRSGVGAACTENNNNCYIASGGSCSFTNCAGSSCDLVCSSDIYFHADPTDVGSPNEGEEWFAFMEVEDLAGGIGFGTSIGQELGTLRAIDVEGPIAYTSVEAGADTAANNASTTVENLGNVQVDIEVQGTDLTDGLASTIPANQQKFATSTFTYSACVSCETLSDSVWVELDVDLAKPIIDTPFVDDDVFWGIAVPLGTNSASHQGINVFTPISP